jgi:hypothetical protein
VEQQLIQTKALPGAWFNHDENFRKSWNEALNLKNQCVMHWWLPVLLSIPDETDFRSMLEQRKSATPGALTHVANAAAVDRKLIRGHIDELSEDTGDTALMRCSAAGDQEGVRVLICASADVHVKDKVGICTTLGVLLFHTIALDADFRPDLPHTGSEGTLCCTIVYISGLSPHKDEFKAI